MRYEKYIEEEYRKAGSVNLFQKGQFCLNFQDSFFLKIFKSIYCCKKL